jgi:iron complex outermembrane receptor protein
MYCLFLFFLCSLTLTAVAQQGSDSISVHQQLREVIILPSNDIRFHRHHKPLASLEEFLESNHRLSLIRRGPYAWEPAVNNMTTDRISVTIDGMHIFHACTDNMDPVTSYVETSNLSHVSISSPADFSPHAANAIGGSLDLSLKKTGFCCRGWEPSAAVGFESNDNAQIANLSLAYSSHTFYLTSGISARTADNYFAGGGDEVPFSHFDKRNTFANLGLLLHDAHALEASFIFDRAVAVGYPALTMDVAKAQAFIASLSYRFHSWLSKLYFNDIVHIMDDSQRSDVTIRMDMPGYSRTSGFFSRFDTTFRQHALAFNLDAFLNRSSAHMVMHPADPNEKDMFMLTWPNVHTLHFALFAADRFSFSPLHSLLLSARLAFQSERINTSGLRSLRIYHPDVSLTPLRLLPNIAANYSFQLRPFKLSLAADFAVRPPSVSEAYGYFLFNTFDAFDYIGNPALRHESAFHSALDLQFSPHPLSSLSLEASHFFFFNYIIGLPTSLSPMTSGSRGLKIYRNIPTAQLFNAALSFRHRFLKFFSFHSRLACAFSRDHQHNPLPLIPPLSANAALDFRRNAFSAALSLTAAAARSRPALAFGESRIPPYCIPSLSAAYDFAIAPISPRTLSLRIGIDNLFDTRYSTFADWNHIPRKGRTLFINLSLI